jgi:hypothetical protein
MLSQSCSNAATPKDSAAQCFSTVMVPSNSTHLPPCGQSDAHCVPRNEDRLPELTASTCRCTCGFQASRLPEDDRSYRPRPSPARLVESAAALWLPLASSDACSSSLSKKTACFSGSKSRRLRAGRPSSARVAMAVGSQPESLSLITHCGRHEDPRQSSTAHRKTCGIPVGTTSHARKRSRGATRNRWRGCHAVASPTMRLTPEALRAGATTVKNVPAMAGRSASASTSGAKRVKISKIRG